MNNFNLIFVCLSYDFLNTVEPNGKSDVKHCFFNRSCNDKERFDEDGKNAVFNCNAKVHYGLKTAKILATL